MPKAYQVPLTWMMLGSGKSLAITGPTSREVSWFEVLMLTGEAIVMVKRLYREVSVRRTLTVMERRGGHNMSFVCS